MLDLERRIFLLPPKVRHPINKLSFIVLALSYYFLLGAFYADYVTPLFDYALLTLDYSQDAAILGALSIVGLSMLLPSRESLIAAADATILLLAYIPSVVVWAYGPADNKYFVIETIGVAVVILTSRLVKVPIPQLPKLSSRQVVFLFIGVAVVYFAGIIAAGGSKYINFDLTAVYDFRDEAANALPELFAYVSPIVGKVIIPFIAVLSASRGNVPLCLSAFGMSVFAFALTSQKETLFVSLLSVVVFYTYRSTNRFLTMFSVALIVCVVISIVDFHFIIQNPEAGSSIGDFGSLFGRRTLILPSFVNYLWVDFFSTHKLIYWSESKFTFGALKYPYDLPSPQVIGYYYYNSVRMSANTSWVGSGFANAGVPGVILYSILLGLFVSYLNTAAKKIPEAFVLAASFVMLLTLTVDSDLVTSLVTHGLLFYVLLVALIYNREFAGDVSRIRRV